MYLCILKWHSPMIPTEAKSVYEAPAAAVVEVKTESVILQMSKQDYNYYGGLDEVMMM